MKRYDSYKDSGVGWIGEIPSHWKVERLAGYINFSKGLPITKADLIAEGVPVISYGQIHSKENTAITLKDSLLRFVSSKYKETTPQCLLKKYDLVFVDTSEDFEGAGNFVLNDRDEDVFAGYHTMVVRLLNKGNINPIYLAHLLNSNSLRNQTRSEVDGVKVYTISKQIIKLLRIVIPPSSEQQAIVDYLKDKTLKIEQYVSARERERELLSSLKQSEIANVVTKGLNPNVRMKDSGIPWIGLIPEHWETRTLSQMARVHFISNKNVHHQNLLSLSYGKIVCKDINTTEGLLPASFDNYQIVEDGNIVLRLTDLQNDHKSLRVGLSTQEGIITSAYLAIEAFTGILPKYLYFLLHSIDVKKVFYSMGNGLRQSLNWTELRKLKCIVPPILEQQAIVNYIEAKLSKIESCMADLQAEIDYLKEFKQRLISDVVTGQICVAEPQKGEKQ